MAWIEVCSNCRKGRAQEAEPCLPATLTTIYAHTWMTVCSECGGDLCSGVSCICTATLKVTKLEVHLMRQGISCINYGREDWPVEHRRLVRKLEEAEFSTVGCELHQEGEEGK